MAFFYKATVFLNSLIFLFSLAILITASVYISQYNNADFLFSRSDFVWLLLGGLVGMIVSLMGCWGARDPVGKYNLLFCYFFLISIVLVMFSIGFYLYRVFVLDLEAAADGEVEGAFRLESAKEFNDLILSIYTTCCTGCVAGTADCIITFDALFDPDPCDGQVCADAEVCDAAQLLINEGLDQGCIINSQVNPSYDLGDNFCIFFSEFATDEGGNNIVGPVADGQCGGGNPRVFVNRVGEFIGKNYIVIVSFWGLGLVFLFMAWLGSLFMLLCPHRYEEWNK